MRWTSSKVALVSVAILGLLLFACNRPDERMYPIGPGVKADLVVFFKSDATNDQIYAFATKTIADPAERGYQSLPGMSTTLLVSVDRHQGYAISFFPEATAAQRKYVRSRIDASPLVFKVFENVAPKDITSLK